MIESGGVTTGLSNSDKLRLSNMFPNSPIYSMTEADLRAQAQSLMMPTTQEGDLNHFPNGVNMDYAGLVDQEGSPDLSTPPVGFDSSYYPNLNLNGVDPSGGEGTKTDTLIEANDNYGFGGKADTVLPSSTAAIIAQTTIDVFGPIAPLGQSGANLSTGTVTTHIINEGAISS
jgi:hypothetical protein